MIKNDKKIYMIYKIRNNKPIISSIRLFYDEEKALIEKHRESKTLTNRKEEIIKTRTTYKIE